MNAETPEQELARLRKAQQQQEDSGWWKKIQEFLSFDFGGMIGNVFSAIFWVGIIAAVYYVARENKDTLGQWFGKENVDKFFDWADDKLAGLADSVGLGIDVTAPALAMPADKFKEELTKASIPADIADLLAANKDAFLKTAQKANGGKATKSELTNDKTIYQLMLDQPELTQKLAALALKPGSSAANSDTAKQIKQSVAAIIADETRLTTLLSGTQRTHTVALLKQFAPAAIRDDIDAIIKEGMSTGKPSEQLRNLLTRALDGVTTAPSSTSSGAPATTGQTAAAPAATGAATEFEKTLAEIEKDPKNKAAYATLKDTFKAQGKFQDLVTALAGNELTQMKFALENRAAFEAFTKAANLNTLPKDIAAPLQILASLPQAATAPTLAILGKGQDPRRLQAMFFANNRPLTTAGIVEQLFKPENRALLTASGTENVIALVQALATTPEQKELAQGLSKPVLDATLTAINTIQTNVAGKDAVTQRDTLLVVTTFADAILNKNPAALQKLKPEELAKFMNEPANSEALKTLLAQTKDSLPSGQTALAQVYLDHWQLIARLGADTQGAQFLAAAASSAASADTTDCRAPGSSDTGPLALLKRMGTDLVLTWKGTDFTSGNFLGDNIVGRNRPEIELVIQKLQVANCNSPAAPARNAGSRPAPQPGLAG